MVIAAITALTQPNVELIIIYSYYAAVICFCLVLFGGAFLMWQTLRRSLHGSKGDGTSGSDILVEYIFSPSGEVSAKFSFSRFAGAVGAIGFAALFVSFGFWALCGLFLQPALLKEFGSLWGYLLTSAAFFFPYATNQIATHFGKSGG
ncbi:MAG: hypothetical protein AAF618_02930 [Pseudomonadota bacterium]